MNRNSSIDRTPIVKNVRSSSPANSSNMSVKVFNKGRDFNDYEIKNSLSGQTSRTRVIFLAD